MSKPYSQLSVAIDLVQNEYNISNPIIIAEKIKEVLGLSYTIHQISDYLDINKQDYEKESNQIEYYSITNN